jgi:hypothetical protein
MRQYLLVVSFAMTNKHNIPDKSRSNTAKAVHRVRAVQRSRVGLGGSEMQHADANRGRVAA